ncbi:unnamed protein product [Rhizophagus irregularis]|nr:unnamed protein product [Rhizophagus irregularis]
MSDISDSQNNNNNNNIFLSKNSNIINYESTFKFNIKSPNIIFINDFMTKLFKELLQELYIILLNAEVEEICDSKKDKLNEFINNFLFEYDLDPKNVFEIITSNSQNIYYYSSLVGFFYQNGIGCNVDEIKAYEIFSNAVKNNNQRSKSKSKSTDQENDSISFYCNDNNNINEIIVQYFYSLFLYKDIILFRKDNYKLHKRNAENGDPVSQYYIAEYYFNNKNEKKAFKWYLKLANKNFIRAIYLVAKYYRDGNGTDKNLIEASKWFSKYELSKIYGCKLITLNNFLEGLDINAFEIETYKHLP